MTEPKEISYKDTLNLPETSFAMKASLAQREPEMLAQWEKDGLYERIREKSSKNSKGKYILHDGPPYANGKIHIGHALNKILKDIIVKFKTMSGYDALYVPGWDCHGLPIEHQCLKDMGKRKEEVERIAFRKQARQYAEKFIGIQREDFKRLGVFGRWQKPYQTMDYAYQASIADSFLRLAEKGYIYQGLKPVPWCFDCETALADAELEYEDKTSSSVYVKFQIKPESLVSKLGAKAKSLTGKKAFFLVWTTTPWTLPANVGVALHPDLTYDIHVFSDEVWILAEARLGHLESLEFGMGSPAETIRVKGKDLIGTEYQHPFLEREGKAIAADYVSADDGTGIVHIAPGHGEDDYRYGHEENNLPILSPVDSRGRFTEEFSPAKGIHVFKANEMIVEILKEKKLLLAQEAHKHSYPHCWRCKKPILFRATKQWFMKIDHENLRTKMLGFIQKQIQFTPDWGKKRIGSMVETRPEWCLSRQRYWGVPIPMILCKKCPQKTFIQESKSKIVELFETEGADAWFSHTAEAFLPKGFKCPGCGGSEFIKEEDIIDVWFDSGVSHQAVLRRENVLGFPAALYLEGSDQHRGWFQSSLTTSVALEGEPPFKGVLTHGFVVDGDGRKMSKSAGNVVAPQDVMKEFGADILRLWVSSCDYEYDVRLSPEILKQLADSYRKIRNTFRYMLGNLYDFDPKKDALKPADLHPLDQWAVGAANEMFTAIRDRYNRFAFHQIYQLAHQFCVVELSGYYFDILKDTLYTAHKKSKLRRSAQTGIFYMLSHLAKLLAPILPFTMDEVWKAFPVEEGTLSIHESRWEENLWAVSEQTFKTWKDIRLLRDAVMPMLEAKRELKLIGANLDAKVSLKTDHPKAAALIREHLKELPRIFVTSQVEWLEKSASELQEPSYTSIMFNEEIKIRVLIEKADGGKCSRCWNYSAFVGSHPKHPSLCGKCVEAMEIK